MAATKNLGSGSTASIQLMKPGSRKVEKNRATIAASQENFIKRISKRMFSHVARGVSAMSKKAFLQSATAIVTACLAFAPDAFSDIEITYDNDTYSPSTQMYYMFIEGTWDLPPGAQWVAIYVDLRKLGPITPARM
ncbi:MAG: hypothetical protein ACRC1K_06610 [Planctomycetia bacterium]